MKVAACTWMKSERTEGTSSLWPIKLIPSNIATQMCWYKLKAHVLNYFESSIKRALHETVLEKENRETKCKKKNNNMIIYIRKRWKSRGVELLESSRLPFFSAHQQTEKCSQWADEVIYPGLFFFLLFGLGLGSSFSSRNCTC